MDARKATSAIVVGSGISGMSCALELAKAGVSVTLLSPAPSERSQSVMAAGGINAVLANCEPGDSVQQHVEDTLAGGAHLAGRHAVEGLCSHAEEIIQGLVDLGTVFTVDGAGKPVRRSFGGQSYSRTYYCGAATGKQIVSALVMEERRFEAKGLVTRRLRCHFHSALIRDGVCYGALVYDENSAAFEALYADAVVMATGGQNALFGKTTGSTMCDGYAAARLFMQGVPLKNLEFVQFHPTTLETPQKRMLVSEAVRGEGGRLFYEQDGTRVYFMEDKYGPAGNLMTRDVVSREIEATGRQVYLDISFLGSKEIDRRIPEVRDICRKYRGIDISKEPIPVSPSVHFFMGGIAVHMNHETDVRNLYAVGECASMYHGANRLGGNSLLAALYSGKVAARSIAERDYATDAVAVGAEQLEAHFAPQAQEAAAQLDMARSGESAFPVAYIRGMLEQSIQTNLGIVRDAASLAQGIADIDYYLSIADKIAFDSSLNAYEIYSLVPILSLARAVLTCAYARTESRGAHYRSDYPESSEDFACATIVSFDDGAYRVSYDKEQAYEN